MKQEILKVFLAVSLFLPLAGFALADCPNKTLVEGTKVTFVGEVTDMGGDSSVQAWFEYGKTDAYGEKTSEITLTKAGVYCVTVEGLSPCATYHYRAVAKNAGGTSYGEDKTFRVPCLSVSVDLKANNSDGPITVPYNGSFTLSWNASNADSCSADWTSSKATSGSETISNFTTSRTFTITCQGPAGSASDSVVVNVEGRDFKVRKYVRNISDGTGYFQSVYADPAEILGFLIEVETGDAQVCNLRVRDSLPEKISVISESLRVDNSPVSGNIISGIDLGCLPAHSIKRITYTARLAGSDAFPFGQTSLINVCSVSIDSTSTLASAQILVRKGAVAGATTGPTGVSTGLIDDLSHSLLIPFLAALLLVFVFKTHLIRVDEWLDERKKRYLKYRAKKELEKKIAKIKNQGV
jgi:hypothetical protein